MLLACARRCFARSEWLGLILLLCALAYNAWYVFPETHIGRVPLNDQVFHLAASERMATAIQDGEPFLNPWVSEWALGYPVWQSYQPLPHLAGAAVLRAFRSMGTPSAIFAIFYYLLIVTFPLSAYMGARLLGLPAAAAGLVSLLVFAPSGFGDLGRYDLGYGSVVWRGSGLYTQLFAMHLMVIGLGLTARAVDSGGRARQAGAALTLALTSLSHIIFGYTAFVSAVVLAVVGPRAQRRQRLRHFVSVVIPALLLLAWFVVPLFLVKQTINHSRWEDPQKWDSYGARFILRELASGRLLDYGRAPVLGLLLGAGILGALLHYREPLARRLLSLTAVWLALFFGRTTWGSLIALAGVPSDLPLHRFQSVFEFCAILLAAYGVTRLVAYLKKYDPLFAAFCTLCVAFVVISVGTDRAGYLAESRRWGEETLAAYQQQRGDLKAALQDARAIVAERPGRVSAGLAATWGRTFRVGAVPVFAFLTREHFDQASFLYHAMSKPGDLMVARDENSPAQNTALGIRCLIAPANQPEPPEFHLRSTHGQFAVYEVSPEGYFGLVDVAGYFAGPPEKDYDLNAAWLKSPLVSAGDVLSLDTQFPIGTKVEPGKPLPVPEAAQLTPRGKILSESKHHEIYKASVDLVRPAWVLLKITWHPYLVATVDGQRVRLIRVTPGFGAMQVSAGRHKIQVSYQPGPLRLVLLILGCVAFVGCFVVRRPQKTGRQTEPRVVASEAQPAVVGPK